MVKVAETGGDYFTASDNGVEVVITGGSVNASSKGNDFLNLEFELDGKEGYTGFNNYLTEKALPYTAQRVQGILTHNAKGQGEEDKVKRDIEEVADDAFGDWAIDQLTGKKAYLAVTYSQNTNPKTGRPYLEFNLQGWAPKPLVDAPARQVMGGGEDLTKEESSNIPF